VRIWINSGIEIVDPGRFLIDPTINRETYRSGVYWPRNDWRPLSALETDLLHTPPLVSSAATSVYIFAAPFDFASLFSNLGLQSMARSRKEWEEGKRTGFPLFVSEVAKFLEDDLLLPFELCSAEVSFTPRGVPTSTYDGNQKRYRGLHVDNWTMPVCHLRERSTSSLRLGLNVGSHSRSFVFINLTIATMFDLLSRDPDSFPHREVEYSDQHRNHNASSFTEAFMQRFIDYPVIRVELPPNYGYLAPVNNIIHDGYALHNQSTDSFLQLSAHNFRLRPRRFAATVTDSSPRSGSLVDKGSDTDIEPVKGAETYLAHSTHGPLELLIVQPTPFCNLNCKYCYLPERHDTQKMTIETFEAALRWVFEAEIYRDEFTIVWHAGEPLVMPMQFYRQAADSVRRLNHTRCRITQSLQTNGTLINNDWCTLFRDVAMKVGISIDGPAAIHDSYRRTLSGRPTHSSVERGIEHLRRNDIPFHAIAVVTNRTLADPTAFFQYFADMRVTTLGLNFEEIEGINRRSSLTDPALLSAFRDFVRCALQFTASHGLRVREIQSEVKKILSAVRVRSTQVIPFKVVSVDHSGRLSTFSPELLGSGWPENSTSPDFALGCVHTDTYGDVITSPKFLRLFSEVSEGVSRCQETCEFFEVCGGGAPSNKYFENGSFATAETLYCLLRKKIVHEEVLRALEDRYSDLVKVCLDRGAAE